MQANSYSSLVGQNILDNGDFSVWQRGTTICPASVSAQYTADRWMVSSAGAAVGACSREIAAPATIYAKYSMELTGQTSTQSPCVQQRLPVDASGGFNGNWTFSAYVYHDMGSAQTPKLQLYYADSADTFTTMTALTSITDTQSVAASTWTRITCTVNMSGLSPNRINGIMFAFFPVAYGANFTASNHVYLTGLKFEPGTVASPFVARSYGEELRKARYHYRRSGGAAIALSVAGYVVTGNNLAQTFYMEPMRAKPTPHIYGTWEVSANLAQPSIYCYSNDTFQLLAGASASASHYFVTAAATCYIELSAEL